MHEAVIEPFGQAFLRVADDVGMVVDVGLALKVERHWTVSELQKMITVLTNECKWLINSIVINRVELTGGAKVGVFASQG